MSTELINRPREGYQLTGFYGGDARGYCLQITSDHGYVQVTREGAARLASDIFRHFLETPGPAEAQATLARAARLFEEALPKFNWGASALDANAIQLLNEVPGEVRAALKACALCGGEGHTAPNCPWAKEGGA